MGTLASPLKKIDNLRFCPISGRGIKTPHKIVKIEDHVFVTTKTRPQTVYTTSYLAGKVCVTNTRSDCSPVKALVALGVITKAEAKAHGARADDYERLAQERRAADQLPKLAAALGIKLTPKQLKRISDTGFAAPKETLDASDT